MRAATSERDHVSGDVPVKFVFGAQGTDGSCHAVNDVQLMPAGIRRGSMLDINDELIVTVTVMVKMEGNRLSVNGDPLHLYPFITPLAHL